MNSRGEAGAPGLTVREHGASAAVCTARYWRLQSSDGAQVPGEGADSRHLTPEGAGPGGCGSWEVAGDEGTEPHGRGLAGRNWGGDLREVVQAAAGANRRGAGLVVPLKQLLQLVITYSR